MPQGKPANTPCVQLDAQQRCKLFASPLRPAVCGRLQPSAEMCHQHRDDAMYYLLQLEAATAP
ncbi:proteinase inhibitor [Dickeya aquatica]|uniref:Proteinase inhibitor n=2 Tax=Pectobacteriaceae TaxID=1903410 RepID=A0A375AA48_9GAMM|nr:proteinase inhibitor [Dickeya aquatica]